MKWKNFKHLLFTSPENLSQEENRLRLKMVSLLFGVYFLALGVFSFLFFKSTAFGIILSTFALFAFLIFLGTFFQKKTFFLLLPILYLLAILLLRLIKAGLIPLFP